jgi:hypothetical protein
VNNPVREHPINGVRPKASPRKPAIFAAQPRRSSREHLVVCQTLGTTRCEKPPDIPLLAAMRVFAARLPIEEVK